ncbi:GntR family transcriptional regulator [Isachenkonia alkalipeptolytica]|uniref:GntR family transcriptional regulator n=1 Tax=Isachenkonia alkalipeptolytica TaxID=2565777 RepID=A0AA43XKX8_9CLOT|nr:GntR family transcriptional regulator [Isachenkonia alkalipeptolytica]NBG88236.1 GntR family transcriptional regulator [Isachenkonia alkalipeptolytica]
MNLLISNLSQTPIYEQIQNQITEMILSGKITSGEQLPSIRLMAKELKVGIITVKRAYEELEKEKLVVNLQGRGCFVREIDLKVMKRQHLKVVRNQLKETLAYCKKTGISEEELKNQLDRILAGEK